MEATLIQKVVNELQCPTCSGQMVPPLMQCVLGHHCCNKCISENEYCRKCELPLGIRRNYSLENLCFSYLLKCSFAPDGCSFTGTCVIVAEHERCCEVSQKRQQNSATAGEAIRSIEDSKGQSLEEALFAVLECPICSSVILPPIGECSNGHQLCHACFERVENCPICRIPNTYVVNIILGKILKMIVLSCRNVSGGCDVRGSAPSVLRHEKSCNFVMQSCPLTVDGICKWQGAMCHLVEHCKYTHSNRLTLTRDFRFGWYACDGVYRFSVNSFGNVESEDRYSYNFTVFHHTANYWVTLPKDSCGDVVINGNCIKMSQEELMNYSNGSGILVNAFRKILRLRLIQRWTLNCIRQAFMQDTSQKL